MRYVSPILSVFLSFQLVDLSEVFLSTQIEFLKSALSRPAGSVQAVCVPSGAVRTKLFIAHNAHASVQ